MSFKIVNSLDENKWIEFIKNHSQGNIFQTPDMMKVYQKTKKYEPVFLSVVNNSKEILALVLTIIIKEFNGFLDHFSSRAVIYGGLLYAENSNGIKAARLLLKECVRQTQKKTLYTQVRNLYKANQLTTILPQYRFYQEPQVNFFIDLIQGQEAVWNKMDEGRKKNIRKAENRGISIEEIRKKKLLPIIYGLLKETYKKARLPLADISLFNSAFDLLYPDKVRFFLAKYHNDYIATRIVLTFKDTIYDWYAGFSKKAINNYPNEFLIWYILKWGIKNKYKLFDFGEAGNPNVGYGLMEFKRRFGGERVSYKRFQKVHNPLKLWLAKKVFTLYRKMAY